MFFLAKTKPQGAFGGTFLCSFLGGAAIFHFLSSSGYMGQYALEQMTLLYGWWWCNKVQIIYRKLNNQFLTMNNKLIVFQFL